MYAHSKHADRDSSDVDVHSSINDHTTPKVASQFCQTSAQNIWNHAQQQTRPQSAISSVVSKVRRVKMARHGGHHGGNHYGQHQHQPPQSPDPGTPQTPDPTDPPASNAPDFAQLGAVYNDATRAMVGGLWQNVVEEGGQGLGSVFRYVNDLESVRAGFQAGVETGQFTGDTLANVQKILADITTATSAADASVNGGGAFGSVAAAETALHDSHIDVLNIVNGDANLKALATADGATGFQAVPATLNGVTAENAPRGNLAELGAIFNDAANRILGGVNESNAGIITNDINTVISGLHDLQQNNPLLFGGLSGVHAEAVNRQLQLELDYIKQAGVTPDAGRASNDNILDIIDIIQGDTNLANMAFQGGVSGFTPFPDALNPTPKYLDNEGQTTFWANFIAQSNSLGQQAMQLVGSGDQAAINGFIGQLDAFQKYVTDFDAAQGGIFQARFDNELLGETSTLGAEVDKMIEGLRTGNAPLVAAAADQMHANSADVGGNNIPITGGVYNPDGLTVADVLSTAGQPAPAAAAVAAAAPAGAAAPAVVATSADAAAQVAAADGASTAHVAQSAAADGVPSADVAQVAAADGAPTAHVAQVAAADGAPTAHVAQVAAADGAPSAHAAPGAAAEATPPATPATPATPAVPGAAAEPATPATPAIPASPAAVAAADDPVGPEATSAHAFGHTGPNHHFEHMWG
jgi:hypothetical protein